MKWYKISFEHILECISLPTVHSLLCQLLVEVWSVGRDKKGSFLDLTQPNVGFTISAQNHLKTTQDMKYMYDQCFKTLRGVHCCIPLSEREKVIVHTICFLTSIYSRFGSPHLWPRVSWSNSNGGQNCRTQTCSPMFTQTKCKSSTNLNFELVDS